MIRIPKFIKYPVLTVTTVMNCNSCTPPKAPDNQAQKPNISVNEHGNLEIINPKTNTKLTAPVMEIIQDNGDTVPLRRHILPNPNWEQ